MVDVEQALGTELMDATRRREVIDRLRKLPLPQGERGFLFRRWAALVNYRYTNEEYDRVTRDVD